MSDNRILRLLPTVPLGPDSLEKIKHTAEEAGAYVEILTPRQLPEAEVIFGWPDMKLLGSAGCLKWVQLDSAGAEGMARSSRRPSDLIVTNASGVFGIPIAEHVFGMLLALSRRVGDIVRNQTLGRWSREYAVDEIYGKTMLILGLGDIGSEVAKRAKAFGMRVVGVKRSISGDKISKHSYADEIHPISSLDSVLPEADILVLALPLTKDTEKLVNADRIASLKPSCYVINVGRGAVIDEKALCGALASGALAGAGLDVFEEEPLPAGSPLWSMPNVIISPHVSGNTPVKEIRVVSIFCRNLKAYLMGEPMANVVDMDLGY